MRKGAEYDVTFPSDILKHRISQASRCSRATKTDVALASD
jgi:hypothetical protein